MHLMTFPTLPTLNELLNPQLQPESVRAQADASTDLLDPIHLFDMTWKSGGGGVKHLVLPQALTGVAAPIVVMTANHFPTGSHKVGPAFSCLREGLLSGELSVDGSTLVFPSTGNYGIGGAWVGPRVGFRSLVVLPEKMSAERFEMIRGFGAEIIATPGSESNVKEIYDKVAELRQIPHNRILNQFEDFGNYRFHYYVTGNSALDLAAELAQKGVGKGRIAAFVSAMGSAGTIAAADRIRQENSELKTVGLEPVQCPTLFNVGYGAHAIEGIGDKHVTWIHNVRAMDLLICIDDQQCLEGLRLLQAGSEYLQGDLGLDADECDQLVDTFGVSGICNILGAIRTARYYNFGADQPVFTVATDGFDRYPSVLNRLDNQKGRLDGGGAGRTLGYFLDPSREMELEGSESVRRRWHNQKYFSWVEQLGKSLDELEALWEPQFWEEQGAGVERLDAAAIDRRETT